MDYILEKIFVESPLLERGCCTICPKKWMILLIWRWRHSQSHKREETDGDRWCHAKNINTAIWCLILPSLPLTLLALVALIAGPKWALEVQGHVAGMCWESATWSWRHTSGPCAWLTGSMAVLHNLCLSHTHTRFSCDIVCVSSVLWRVRGQMDSLVVKETTFIWNTIFSTEQMCCNILIHHSELRLWETLWTFIYMAKFSFSAWYQAWTCHDTERMD